MTQVLEAIGLSKTIGKKQIVRDINLSLREGEVFGFLGPNGAGKTTTIRMLVGLIRPTTGSVRICGYDLEREFEKATRCFGCIVENPDLYRFMTGRENLEHFARMIGGGAEKEIDRLADLVNLRERIDDRVRTYSLGMRQRLGIAQALLGSPRLLILDEPANGLDPAGIREMRELLRSLARERGMSVFVSSHLLAEIELMCDRVAIIHRGSILKSGSVEELIARRKEMELDVDDVQRAKEIAARFGLAVEEDASKLVAHTDEERTPELVRALVEAGVSIRSVQPRVQTLEDTFLAATGGETVV